MTDTESKPKRVYRCSACSKEGHQARSCPDGEVSTDDSRSVQAARWLAAQVGDYTFRSAAAKFGLRHQAVQQVWRRLYGDRPTPSSAVIDERNARIIELARTGMNGTEVAVELGLSHRIVSQVCTRAKVPLRVTKREWPDAIAAVAAGASITEAAVAAGVSPGRLGEKCKESGVKPRLGSGIERRDGRSIRAAILVEHGVPRIDALKQEKCSLSGLKAMLRKRAKARQQEAA